MIKQLLIHYTPAGWPPLDPHPHHHHQLGSPTCHPWRGNPSPGPLSDTWRCPTILKGLNEIIFKNTMFYTQFYLWLTDHGGGGGWRRCRTRPRWWWRWSAPRWSARCRRRTAAAARWRWRTRWRTVAAAARCRRCAVEVGWLGRATIDVSEIISPLTNFLLSIGVTRGEDNHFIEV